MTIALYALIGAAFGVGIIGLEELDWPDRSHPLRVYFGVGAFFGALGAVFGLIAQS